MGASRTFIIPFAYHQAQSERGKDWFDLRSRILGVLPLFNVTPLIGRAFGLFATPNCPGKLSILPCFWDPEKKGALRKPCVTWPESWLALMSWKTSWDVGGGLARELRFWGCYVFDIGFCDFGIPQTFPGDEGKRSISWHHLRVLTSLNANRVASIFIVSSILTPKTGILNGKPFR